MGNHIFRLNRESLTKVNFMDVGMIYIFFLLVELRFLFSCVLLASSSVYLFVRLFVFEVMFVTLPLVMHVIALHRSECVCFEVSV